MERRSFPRSGIFHFEATTTTALIKCEDEGLVIQSVDEPQNGEICVNTEVNKLYIPQLVYDAYDLASNGSVHACECRSGYAKIYKKCVDASILSKPNCDYLYNRTIGVKNLVTTFQLNANLRIGVLLKKLTKETHLQCTAVMNDNNVGVIINADTGSFMPAMEYSEVVDIFGGDLKNFPCGKITYNTEAYNFSIPQCLCRFAQVGAGTTLEVLLTDGGEYFIRFPKTKPDEESYKLAELNQRYEEVLVRLTEYQTEVESLKRQLSLERTARNKLKTRIKSLLSDEEDIPTEEHGVNEFQIESNDSELEIDFADFDLDITL